MENLENTYQTLLKEQQDANFSKVCDCYYLLVLIKWKTYVHSLKSKIELVTSTTNKKAYVNTTGVSFKKTGEQKKIPVSRKGEEQTIMTMRKLWKDLLSLMNRMRIL